MSTADDVVREREATLAPLERAANSAWWDAATRAGDETEARRAAAEVAMLDALGDAEAFAAIRAARAASTADTDAGTARVLRLLDDAHAPYQVPGELRRQIVELQSAVEARFARHRGTIAGAEVDDNDIVKILRASDDSGERREAWEAAKTVGAEVAGDVRELARLRNTAARSLGFRDHFEMALTTNEYDEQRLLETLDAVDRITDAPFRAWKAALDAQLSVRFGCAPADLRPWHYEDPFFQQAPSAGAVDLDPVLDDLDVTQLTARTFDGLDLETAPILARSDLLPRDGKSQHAFCIDVDRAGDVRVLSNNVPGEQWTETMLHEFGHGVYFAGLDPSAPWLLRTMHMCVTEGVAMLCGRLVHEPEWLHAVAGVPASEVDALAARLADARRARLLVFVRWVLVMTNFERALYSDPERDLDALWWELIERFQLLQRPDGRRAPDWAAKIHLAVAPVYYQNYLFGELIASRLSATLNERFGGMVDRPEAGTFLAREIFTPGARARWDQLIEQATGSPLTAEVLAHELAAR